MNDRIHCLVPFCKRTTPLAKHPGASEWICGKHWAACDPQLRRLHYRVKRRITNPPRNTIGSPLHAYAMAVRVWERLKAQAITNGGNA